MTWHEISNLRRYMVRKLPRLRTRRNQHGGLPTSRLSGASTSRVKAEVSKQEMRGAGKGAPRDFGHLGTANAALAR
ncbi:MAG TPA: hypothetical protein VN699_18340, partial [Pirellulales bacterium]|nr:hypothetical protein [Pirellulales bacterium]